MKKPKRCRMIFRQAYRGRSCSQIVHPDTFSGLKTLIWVILVTDAPYSQRSSESAGSLTRRCTRTRLAVARFQRHLLWLRAIVIQPFNLLARRAGDLER